MKTYRTQIEVRGYELDSFGHVNHANYLNYLEHARWNMLADEGITLPKLQEIKRWPVIAEMELAYLKPTFMGDILEIETRCVDHSRISFTFEQTILKAGVPVMKATVRGVMVNEKGRPASYPIELEGLWK
jgi:thioesterase-3